MVALVLPAQGAVDALVGGRRTVPTGDDTGPALSTTLHRGHHASRGPPCFTGVTMLHGGHHASRGSQVLRGLPVTIGARPGHEPALAAPRGPVGATRSRRTASSHGPRRAGRLETSDRRTPPPVRDRMQGPAECMDCSVVALCLQLYLTYYLT